MKPIPGITPEKKARATAHALERRREGATYTTIAGELFAMGLKTEKNAPINIGTLANWVLKADPSLRVNEVTRKSSKEEAAPASKKSVTEELALADLVLRSPHLIKEKKLKLLAELLT